MATGSEFVDLGTDDASVVGMKVTGKATAETISELVERLEQIQGAGKKARLYLDLTAYDGCDLGVVEEKLAHMGTLWSGIERCAYVFDKGWMATMIGLVSVITVIEGAIFKQFEGPRSRRMFCRPTSVPA